MSNDAILNRIDVNLENLVATLREVYEEGDQITRVFIEHAIDNAKLFHRKHQDYGPGNIAAFGAFGVLVRADDKIERLKNLKKRGEITKNESIIDTWQDIANYGIIGEMCEKGLWK